MQTGTNRVYVESFDVRVATLQDGSQMKCRGGEDAVWNCWQIWPVVHMEISDEVELLNYFLLSEDN